MVSVCFNQIDRLAFVSFELSRYGTSRSGDDRRASSRCERQSEAGHPPSEAGLPRGHAEVNEALRGLDLAHLLLRVRHRKRVRRGFSLDLFSSRFQIS